MPFPTASQTSAQGLPKADLSHLPHLPEAPFLGHTLALIRDSYDPHRRSLEAFGPIYRIKTLGHWRVSLNGPDALDCVLMDREQLFRVTMVGTLCTGCFRAD